QPIQVVGESLYWNGSSWQSNDTSAAPKNNIPSQAVDFTDRSQFGTATPAILGHGVTSSTGWAVYNGVHGYTKVFKGAITNGNSSNRDVDYVKVYLYAGERLRIDVDGVSGTNSGPANNITREVFNGDGTSVLSGTTSDTWFTAGATG